MNPSTISLPPPSPTMTTSTSPTSTVPNTPSPERASQYLTRKVREVSLQNPTSSMGTHDQSPIQDKHEDEDRDSATTQSTAMKIKVKNRRARYLEMHPEYFDGGLELADPLLYDRLIRRFQTTSDREAEGRRKGYSGVLEADLYRGEAKLHAIRNPDPNATVSYRRGQNGEILAEETDEIPATKEEGLKRWKYEMERRFVEGRDGDFRYEVVDGDERYDDVRGEEREAEEKWFEMESPGWVTGGKEGEEERLLVGETGVQDF